MLGGTGHGLYQAQGMARHGRIGKGIGLVQIGGLADDAVELAAELHLAAEHPSVQLQFRWRIVTEVHADRAPARAEQGAAHAEQYADGQLHALAYRRRRVGDDLFAQHHGLAHLVHEQRQGLVEQMAVLHDGFQRVAQGWLVRQQQADDAEVGELARFGHAQAEGGAVAELGGLLQQASHRGGGQALLGVFHQRLAEACLAQHLLRIEAEVLGHFDVVGQGRCANHWGHVDRHADCCRLGAGAHVAGRYCRQMRSQSLTLDRSQHWL
ncbi:hypothetical protein D3C76_956060 [compost metagenome]